MIKLKSRAYHLGENISIDKAIYELDYSVSRTEDEFAMFEVGENSWIYLKNYGSIVFINVAEDILKKTMGFFLNSMDELDDLPSEDFEIIVESKLATSVSYGVIEIPEISIDHAHVIAFNLSQTVALDDFQNQVESLLKATSDYSAGLVGKGKLNSSRRDIRKLMGKALVLKNRVAENLYIFDTPDVAWSDEYLANLYDQMRNDLDIEKRHHGLQLNLDIVKENLDLYQNILQHRHSSLLEWIIIILILFEVIQVLIVE
jgi:uncharacterized Rmd1/YagE family protein